MYVQIVKSRLSTFWYANHIGKIYSVKDSDKYPEDYKLDYGEFKYLGCYLEKDDCQIVSVNEEVKEMSE